MAFWSKFEYKIKQCGMRSLSADGLPPQSLATVFIIIFVFPSPRPLPCINKKFMNSDGHQMAWTVRSARVYRIQRSKSIKLNTDSRVVAWQLEEKYISYHSPTIKNDITRSDACKRRRNSVKSSDVGRQKVPCTSQARMQRRTLRDLLIKKSIFKNFQ